MISRILVLLLVFNSLLFAQEGSSEPEYRFLFVIDNSYSMRTKKEAVIKTVQDLIATGFHNQAEEGERFGIWTYNDKVQKQFPSQVWNRREAEKLAAIAGQFLDSEKAEGKTDLLPAFLELDRYASQDRDMLVFLVCEGDEGIVGTPYDSEINRIFMEYHRILQRSRKPFLLTFAYHRGLMTAARVFYGHGVVELPELVRRQEKRVRELVQLVPVENTNSAEGVQSKPTFKVVPAQPLPRIEPPKPEPEPVPAQPEVSTPPEQTAQAAQTVAEDAKPKPAEPVSPVQEVKTAAVENPSPDLKSSPPEPQPIVEAPPDKTAPPLIETKTAPVDATAPPVLEKPPVQEPVVASVQPPPDIPPSQPPPVQVAAALDTSATTPPPEPEPVEALAPVESLPFKPSNNAPAPATPGVINPADSGLTYWPFVTAGVAFIALIGYLIWNKRRSRPTSSFISQSIQR